MSNQNIGISEASKLVGKSPKTIYAAIKAGKLSASTNIDGQKIVSVSELMRVYGEISKNEKAEPELDTLRQKILSLEQENALLKQRVNDKEELLTSNRSHLEDLRQIVKLLEYKKPTSWLNRLLGK